MFCQSCGQKLDESAEFCAECGERIPVGQAAIPTQQPQPLMQYEEQTQNHQARVVAPALKKRRKTFLIVGIAAASALCVFVLVKLLFGQSTTTTHRRYSFSGLSMLPTIHHSDIMVCSKLSGAPERGDIILFSSPAFNFYPEKAGNNGSLSDPPLVKRVIAVEGDLIQIKDNKVFINGEPEKYASEYLTKYLTGLITAPEVGHPQITQQKRGVIPEEGLIIPKDHVFCMGDNRSNSTDSRDFGAIERQYIIGKVTSISRPSDSSARWIREGIT